MAQQATSHARARPAALPPVSRPVCGERWYVAGGAEARHWPAGWDPGVDINRVLPGSAVPNCCVRGEGLPLLPVAIKAALQSWSLVHWPIRSKRWAGGQTSRRSGIQATTTCEGATPTQPEAVTEWKGWQGPRQPAATSSNVAALGTGHFFPRHAPAPILLPLTALGYLEQRESSSIWLAEARSVMKEVTHTS